MLACLEKWLNNKQTKVEQKIDPVKDSQKVDENEGHTLGEICSYNRDSIFREVIEADNQLPGNSKNSTATSVVVTDEEFYIEPIGASFK